MRVLRIAIALKLLLLIGRLCSQGGASFEMSSSNYGLISSAIVNAGGVMASDGFILQQQFGALHMGRMESETFIIGTMVENFDETANMLPNTISLLQNYPNPFNQNTIFRYRLPQDAEISIAVLSVLGRTITTLYKGTQFAGEFELPYSGIDDIGAPLPSGVYFCRMITKGFDKTIKFAILR